MTGLFGLVVFAELHAALCVTPCLGDSHAALPRKYGDKLSHLSCICHIRVSTITRTAGDRRSSE